MQKTYQFINVVNGVSRQHKTANILFSFESVCLLTRAFFKEYLSLHTEGGLNPNVPSFPPLLPCQPLPSPSPSL